MSKPHAFIAVYTGETVSSARLVAASADPTLVQDVVNRLLSGTPTPEASDPIAVGRRHALRLISDEEERDHAE